MLQICNYDSTLVSPLATTCEKQVQVHFVIFNALRQSKKFRWLSFFNAMIENKWFRFQLKMYFDFQRCEKFLLRCLEV